MRWMIGACCSSTTATVNRRPEPSFLRSAGRRGSGSWASSAIRTILLNPRYRGLYIHGRIKKVRHASGSMRVKAEPKDIIMIDLPEWRIVDDATWFAVAERFTGSASFGSLVDHFGPDCVATPTGFEPVLPA